MLIFDSVGSTNDVALQHAIGTAVLADVQTAGRGRQGRTWSCPPGAGVQLSVTLDPPAALRRPVVLTAWAAVAVCETVRKVTGIPARIKWPNDVLLHGQKTAGILIEMKSVVVAGVGLNVGQTTEQFAAAGLEGAGSLRSVAGRQFARDEVAKMLVIALDEEYAALLDSELAMLESRWAWHVGLLGREVELQTMDDERRQGRLENLTLDAVTLECLHAGRVEFSPEQVRQIRRRE